MARSKQFNTEEVLEKAIRLFWKQGFHATSMEDLVSTLGINRASMYNTFGSKQVLFEQAVERYKNNDIKRIADFLYYQLNVRQGLAVLFQNQIEQSFQKDTPKGCFLVNTITDLGTSNLEFAVKLKTYKAEYQTVFYNYLKYGVDQGQISPYKDLAVLAANLHVFQSGLYVMSKINNQEELMKVSTSTLSALFKSFGKGIFWRNLNGTTRFTH